MEKKKREYKMQLDLTTTYGRVIAWLVGPIIFLTLLKGAYSYKGTGAVAFVLVVAALVSYQPIKKFFNSRQSKGKGKK